MQSLSTAKCRTNFLHFPSCSHLLSTPNGPVTYAEKHGTPGISAAKGASDMRFLTFANTSQTFMFAYAVLCVFPKHASSEGPVPHPGLLRVLGLAVWASAKRGAGIRRRRHFPGRGDRAGDHVRSVGGVELGIRHVLHPGAIRRAAAAASLTGRCRRPPTPQLGLSRVITLALLPFVTNGSPRVITNYVGTPKSQNMQANLLRPSLALAHESTAA
jgi:hypothetical protein